MKCPNCRSEIDNDSIFCPCCGKAIEAPCPKCGKRNASNSRFCKFCGEPLKNEVEEKSQKKAEPKKDEQKPIDKGQRKAKASFILSIIAMSGMVFSMVLLLGLSFGPFLQDSFYPVSSFTVIGYLVDSFSNGFKPLIDDHKVAPFVNGSVLLLFLSLITILSIIFIAMDVPKLVKSIKEKKYYDFSKNVIVLYLLFVLMFAYFRGFALSEDFYCTQISGCAVFAVVFVSLLLGFNLFVKEFNETNHDYYRVIFRAASRLLSFACIIAVLFSIGGLRYSLTIKYMTEPKSSIPAYEMVMLQTESGSLGAFSHLIVATQYVYETYAHEYVLLLIFVVLPFLIEYLLFTFGSLTLKNVFSKNVNKPGSDIRNVIFTALLVMLTILEIVFLNISKDKLNGFWNIRDYGVSTQVKLHTALPITILVFAILLLVNSIVTLCLEKSKKNKEIEENENK